MPSTRELRRRLRSVQSTRQITKAMELVSAAKLRRSTGATIASRPYQKGLWQLATQALADRATARLHPLLAARPEHSVLVIVFGSDRGLAGAYNANLIKQATVFARHERRTGHAIAFIAYGRKIEKGLRRHGLKVVETRHQDGSAPDLAEVRQLGSFVRDQFVTGTVDAVYLLYAKFNSALDQEPRLFHLLPLTHSHPPSAAAAVTSFEPSPEAVLDQLLPRIIDTQLLQALQESVTSEHAARRIAMHSATDNASKMINDLKLTYNSLRQGAITQEIAEITGGAAALGS